MSDSPICSSDAAGVDLTLGITLCEKMPARTAEDTDPAVRLADIVFSYQRGADLPKPSSFRDGSEPPDPDGRGGPVLRGVDLSVPPGTFTVVMGASGGGKSTLLRTLNAIIPDFIDGSFAGDVEVLGRDATATRVSEMADVVGMVLQNYEAQLFGTSIDSEVAFGPENIAVPRAEISDRIDRSLELVGLSDLDRRRSPDTLSGGQKQRLVFAGVMANQPRLLVLDEPTSDLDPAGSHDTLDVIRSLSGRRQDATATGPETIVMVTHEIEESLLADRAVLLRGGRVYREGSTRTVFTDIEALRDARVAVPPVTEAFDRIGCPQDDLPLTPGEAVARVETSGLDWTPPAVRGEGLPGVPAGTAESLGETVFEISGVTHDYATDQGTVRAVDAVDLTIRSGEFVAIVGHNGSGKTTLAKHVNGLLTPDAGSVTWRDCEVSQLPMTTVGRSIGYVFQNPDHQLFADTVREEVRFGPENFGLSGAELTDRVTEAIETVELGELEESDPFTLSKGQRQRVALASVLATDPEVIVFDEPTTGLDAPQQERFMGLVARLNREQGMTVIMVTHSMRTVTKYAPRTVVMVDGRKAADRPTRELFADERALNAWQLKPPQPVALSNRLAADAGLDDALPALSVAEVVTGLGGTDAIAGDGETEIDADGGRNR